ncbi:protein O-mannosyl-transferase TMTC2 [Anabrus simplex]|uniref:protein O-mannosyl-transferase TMTC2 n=1 Tax=Anabrus simplex TaxID=316456 RepID=UPI0035A278BA
MDWACVVSSLTAFCLYVNTLDADFVYDDHRAILDNDDVRADSPLSGLLLHDFWGTPLAHSGSHGSYRPLTVLSFRLNAQLAPSTFHLVNSLLHSATTGTFVRLVRHLTRRPVTPWAAGLLFAAHPVHTEAVAGLVGRADVGAALFFLVSLMAFTNHIKFRDKASSGRSHAYLALHIVLGLCSMLAKEHGVTVFVICVVYEVLYSRYSPLKLVSAAARRPSSRTSVLKQHDVSEMLRCSIQWPFLSFCLMVAFRTYLSGGRFPNFATADNPAAKSPSFLTRTLTFFYLPVFNFYLLLCPATLSFDWSMDAIPLVSTVLDKRNVFSILFYSAFSWVLIYVIKELKNELQSASNSSALVDLNSNHKCQEQNFEKPTFSASNSPSRHRTRQTLSSKSWRRTASLPCLNNNVQDRQRWYRCSCENSLVGSELGDSPRVVVMGIVMLVVPFLPATNLIAYVGFVLAERLLYIPSLGFCLLVAHGFATLFETKKKYRVVLALTATILLVALATKTVIRNRDWNNEEQLYKSGISINPPKAYGNLGNILSQRGRHEEAEHCYRKALLHRPNMADVHYNLGVLLQGQQRWTEAIASYQMAINCRHRLAVAYLNLGMVLARVGRITEAMSVLRTGSSLDGTGLKDPKGHALASTACLFQLGRLSLDQGDPAEAIQVFHQAVNTRPPHYQPQSLFNMLGEAYYRLGQDKQAETWFLAALRSKPDHVPAHLTYGKLLAKNTSRVQEAEVWFTRAESLAPHDAGVFRQYGQFLLSQNRPREAIAKFERIMQMAAGQYEDAMNAATSLRLLGDFSRAEEYYKMAVRLKPKEPAGVANLGALYHITGRFREAEAYYQRALELLPGDKVTMANLKRLRRLLASNDE